MEYPLRTTSEQHVQHVVPHSLLSPFISHYSFHHVAIPPNSYIEKVMPFRLINSIDFFIGDPFQTMDCQSGEIVPFTRSAIRGIQTRKEHLIRLQGTFISFNVKFHVTGLYQLLGIPMDTFRDKVVSTKHINILPFEEITKQLLYADDIKTCINIVEPHLLYLASRKVSVSGVASQAAELLKQQKGCASIRQLALTSNLSLRQLERNFIREIGVSPKIYSRMLRFHRLIQNRIITPNQKWANLASDHDYFDQMHLIKEFKQFLGTTPSAFIPADFAF